MLRSMLLTITMLVSSLAIANDITIVNPSAKTSPATVFGQGYRKAVDGKFYQAANCEDAVRKYNETENAVMIYNSSIEFAARNKGLNCLLGQEKNKQILFVGQTYMKICRLPGTNYDFNKEPTTLGMASMYATKGHEDKFRNAGGNTTIVPYSGSKTVLAALYAGDITLGWMGSGLADKQKDKLDCIYSTDPAAENYIGNKLNLAIPNFRITYVIYTNAKDKKILEILKSAQNDEKFNEFLVKKNTTGTWEITDGSEKAVIKYVDLMFEHWADK